MSSESTEIIFDNETVIKIEKKMNPKKRNNLEKEWLILKDLESKGSIVSPAPIEFGTLPNRNHYMVLPRLKNIGLVKNEYDMMFSILCLKGMGYIHGDYKNDNMSFEDGCRCVFIDFDQALKCNEDLPMDMFLEKLIKTNRNKLAPLQYDQLLSMFVDYRLDLSKTTIFQKGISTKTKNGIYHPVSTFNLFIEGERGLEGRIDILSHVPFSHDETILDIGCNTGLLIRYLINRGCSWVDGYERSKEHAIAGQMINNSCSIFNSRIYHKDITKDKIDRKYDTVILFSVLHHFEEFSHSVNEILNCGCKRIIIESRLVENGMVYSDGHWRKSSRWSFNNITDFIKFLEKMFVGFKFNKNYGHTERNRYILEFIR